MTKQLTGPTASSDRDRQREKYLARLATLPREEQERHTRITLKYIVALLRGDNEPLLQAVAGEDESVQRKARELVSVAADYTVVDGGAE